jgi:hypothetical protein
MSGPETLDQQLFGRGSCAGKRIRGFDKQKVWRKLTAPSLRARCQHCSPWWRMEIKATQAFFCTLPPDINSSGDAQYLSKDLEESQALGKGRHAVHHSNTVHARRWPGSVHEQLLYTHRQSGRRHSAQTTSRKCKRVF